MSALRLHADDERKRSRQPTSGQGEPGTHGKSHVLTLEHLRSDHRALQVRYRLKG